jgi:hypothetical protein
LSSLAEQEARKSNGIKEYLGLTRTAQVRPWFYLPSFLDDCDVGQFLSGCVPFGKAETTESGSRSISFSIHSDPKEGRSVETAAQFLFKSRQNVCMDATYV